MNLYILSNSSYGNCDEETVREFVLLIHEKKMTTEEFHMIVDKYFYDDSYGSYKPRRSFSSLQWCLTEHEDFIQVPTYNY